ncbi:MULTISPECIES: hypothetical protein [unclassified Thiocapsa]|uniref:hypothetical protein n=1 Tax=unclassified Thiocapsa TaxID=2641286 RepID=UPI0035B0C354
MIEIKNDRLHFSFPQVHPEAGCRIDFQRTLRIPDDNRDYPLPPGLGPFPLQHVDDFKDAVPADWIRHGGVFLPMYQAEALWINFGGSYPCAVKIAAGKINAVTGKAWRNPLAGKRQDYVVVPDQPWLDGFAVSRGVIRQFVAMPLGAGYIAEEQLTGTGEHGGIQIVVYPMKAAVYEKLRAAEARRGAMLEMMCCEALPCPSMGLAPGGLMRQEIYDDDYGVEAWDQSAGSRCFVHLLNSLGYLSVTGYRPPQPSPTAADYTRAGLPWFEYFDAEREALEGAAKLAGLDSVAAMSIKKGAGVIADNGPIGTPKVKALGPAGAVREGEF